MDDSHLATTSPLLAPVARTIAVVASLGPATAGNDLGGYGIYIDVVPVLATRRIVQDAGTKTEPLLLINGAVKSLRELDHRMAASVVHCTWAEADDAVMLSDKFKALHLRMRLHAEFLRESGQPIYTMPRRKQRVPGIGLALMGIGVVLAAAFVAANSLRQSDAA